MYLLGGPQISHLYHPWEGKYGLQLPVSLSVPSAHSNFTRRCPKLPPWSDPERVDIQLR